MADKRAEPPRRGRKASVVKQTKTKTYKSFYVFLIGLAIAGVVVLAYVSTRKGNSGAISEVDSTLPPVKSEGVVMGDTAAPLEVLEFGDFECPTCARFAELIEPDVRAQFVNTGKIRFRYVDFPLGPGAGHFNSWNAARAGACADEQGKFWPMHDQLFGHQDQWNSIATRSPDGKIKDLAHQIPGLDAKKFDECVDTRRTQAIAQAQEKLALDRGVHSTPSFFVGDLTASYMSIDEFKKLIDSAMAKRGGGTKPTTKKQ